MIFTIAAVLTPSQTIANISAHILTLLAQHLQAPAKRLKHLNATYRNIVGPTFASSGDTIATFECNISQHRLATLLRRVAPRRDGIENHCLDRDCDWSN